MVPRNGQAELVSGSGEDTEDQANSMTKFRVKKPLNLPEGEEAKDERKIRFEEDEKFKTKKGSATDSLFDDALINSLAEG